MKRRNGSSESAEFSLAVGRALRLAAKRAREVARMHGTPICVSRAGKVVAIKPLGGQAPASRLRVRIGV